MTKRSRQQQFNQREPQGALHQILTETEAEKKLARILFQQDRGHLHEYLGRKFGVQFESNLGDRITFSGSDESASRVKRAFPMLAGLVQGGSFINKDVIAQIASQINPPPGLGSVFKAANQNKPGIGHGGAFTAKNQAQEDLSKLIDANDLTFAVGPAGTGKTHVAVVKAISALKEGKIQKILLARPAAEAGEKIGFLPGDANAKLAPYMRPIYDELDKAFGPGKYQDMLAKGVIEIVPLGYMRGRTFTDAFIIVDEAQNTTIDQIKMALTRIGENSKMVVTGDPTQIDLEHKQSGLMFAVERLRGKKNVGVQEFEAVDVMRSEIVQTIVDAFADAPVQGVVPAPKGEQKPAQNQGPAKPRW